MAGSGSNPNQDKDQSSASRSRSEEPSAAIPFHVLVVEDNESDVFLIQEALEAAKLPLKIHVVMDGEEAVRFFDGVETDVGAPCPALVLLDINLPKRQGGDVLKHMRRSRKCANALVVVVSTADSARDREQMKSLSADEYFHKPSAYDDFMKLGDLVKTLLTGRTHQ